MFYKNLGNSLYEVSHKLIKEPLNEVYFNHIHSYCEILLFINGNANYNIDGKIYTPKPYDLLFIPQATYHYLIPSSPSPYENYVIGFDMSIIDERHRSKLFSPPLMISIKDDPEICSFFSRLDYYNEKYSERDFDTCARSLIKELLIYCSYKTKEVSPYPNETSSPLDSIIDFISENLNAPLNAEIISRHFLLSKSYIQNIFSQSMHIGLKKYIMQKKIYAAKNDLANGISPIEICEKYCFGDYSVFYRLYKKTFGVSPRKFE